MRSDAGFGRGGLRSAGGRVEERVKGGARKVMASESRGVDRCGTIAHSWIQQLGQWQGLHGEGHRFWGIVGAVLRLTCDSMRLSLCRSLEFQDSGLCHHDHVQVGLISFLEPFLLCSRDHHHPVSGEFNGLSFQRYPRLEMHV